MAPLTSSYPTLDFSSRESGIVAKGAPDPRDFAAINLPRMPPKNTGSASGRPLPRVALPAAQADPAVTRSRVSSRPPTQPPSQAPTVATVEEVPEPVETPVVQQTTHRVHHSTPTPVPGDTEHIGSRSGADGLLSATVVRTICVQNDADLETRLKETVATIRQQIEGEQTANDVLIGDVQTLRRDMNRLLEQIGSLAAAIPQTQQPTVMDTPVEVVDVVDTQILGGERQIAVPQSASPAVATATAPQQANISGLTELVDRLSRLEKKQSENTGKGGSKRSKEGTKSKARGKYRNTRRKRREDDDEDPSSSPSSSSSSDSDGSSDSEGEERRRRKRRHQSPASGAKRFRKRVVYLDNIIIFSKSVEERFQHVEDILETLKSAGILLKLKTCSFFTNTVKYVGHFIRPGTLEVDATHTTALKKAKHPTTQTQLRAFLGLCSVYCRFVQNYSHIAAPFNAVLRKGQPVTLEPFGENEANAFEALIAAVTSPPILALPQPDLPYSVDTDSSDYQVGCALFQTPEDGERIPIGFWSRSLKPAEKNYYTPEKECLAVVWALMTPRPYLKFESFSVYSDQASLRLLSKIVDPSERLMRWRLRLSEFDFTVQYKRGLCNTQAYTLSRLSTLGETTSEIDDDIPCSSSKSTTSYKTMILISSPKITPTSTRCLLPKTQKPHRNYSNP